MVKEYSLQGRSAPGYKTWSPKKGHPPAPAETARPSAGAGGCPKGAAGLSKPHIGTEGEPYQKPKPSITWYPGASLVDINVPRERPQMPQKDRKPRGKITEWSAASRMRLKLLMGTLLREELSRALVVTLTYPAEFPAPEDHKVYKGHLHTLQIYLRRKWPKCSGIWKLEFQTRGAAHYHLILYGLHEVGVEAVRAWVRETWYKIAHKGDKHLGVAGTQVDPIKSVGGAMSYLGKYISKGDQTMPGNFGGRYWGTVNEEHLPAVEPQTMELDEKTGIRLRRIARKKMQKDVENSRWKRFLEKEKDLWKVGGRLFWETLKSARHGSKRRLDQDGWPKPLWLDWTFKDESPIEVDGIRYKPVYPWLSLPFPLDMLKNDVRRLPRRWKAMNNDRVRIMCNASDFVARINGKSSFQVDFLRWSRGA